MQKIKYIIIALSTIFISACNPNLEGFLATSGDADFTTYVAIGNSLTSGYADGALIYAGQKNSFPVMLAEQFGKAGGGDFTVPYLPQVGNGNDGSGNARRVLGFSTNCLSETSLGPVLASGAATTLDNVAAGGPYNLIGVPGARAVDATFTLYSGLNPFLQRFCANPGTSTMLSEALRMNPTFYSLWLGNNDVLGYATAGGVGEVSPNFPLPGDLVDPSAVQASLFVVMDSMANVGAKGVVATIPDVTSIPYFTTVPYNSVVLTQAQADVLNTQYAQFSIPNITWQEGANPLVIVDSSLTNPIWKIRQATPQDLIVLTIPGDSLRCAQWGVDPTKALTDEWVLDRDEVALCQSYIAQYNTAISTLAASYNVALADMNAYMKTFTSGIVYNGTDLNAEFVTGGAFSLDGVHPNPRGYALIANEFIRAINAHYNATLPNVDVLNYDAVDFP